MTSAGKAAAFAVAASIVSCLLPAIAAEPRKPHAVTLGAARSVPYSAAGDPAGASPGETALKTRALLVDGAVKDWTTGDAHDVTERSFVVRRALRINDALPGEKQDRWVWQRGPWLLVDRVTGRIAALKLPDYDPAVSQAAWFRDYAAYCGVTPSGKSLYAVVAQVAARKPALSKRLSAFDTANPPSPACAPPEWRREPLGVTFRPAGRDPISFDFIPGSAILVEDSGEETEAAAPASPEKPN